MLSDDITGGVKGVLNGIGRMFSGIVRGAILGAALAFGIGALYVGGVALLMAAGWIGGTAAAGAAVGGGTVLAGFTAAASTAGTAHTLWMIMSTAFSMGVSWIPAGAAIGATVLGVTSIIPGTSEGWGVKKMATEAVEAPAQVIGKTLEPQRAPQQDNPYYEEGKGARSAAQGDGKEAAMAKC